MPRGFHSYRIFSCSPPPPLRQTLYRGIDQTEHIVEYKVTSLAIGQKLEGLCVTHRFSFFVDLQPLVKTEQIDG